MISARRSRERVRYIPDRPVNHVITSQRFASAEVELARFGEDRPRTRGSGS
jgi:hypothetical protein